jgi:hypothetical protein
MLKKILTTATSMALLLSSGLQADSCDCSCEKYWLDADYLYWKIQDSPKVVPLVVEIPEVDDVVDYADAYVVLGGKKTDNKWRSGGRFSAGYWIDDCQCYGVEANYFFLPEATKKHSVCSDGSVGSPILAIPFFDVSQNPPQENLSLISFPEEYAGAARLRVRNSMQGAELNALMSTPYTCDMNLRFLGGFRWWNFRDHLTFETSSPYVAPHLNAGDVYQTKDKFQAQNNFYGGQVGAEMDYCCDQFFFNLKGKVALGAMCRKADIHGFFRTNDFNNFGEPLVYPGGYFALFTNHGNHSRTCFSVIPEVDINFGYDVSDCFRIQVGYTFIYVSNVLWASKLVDREINPTQSGAIEFTPTPVLVGEARPRARFKEESLWVQGVNAGFEFKF